MQKRGLFLSVTSLILIPCCARKRPGGQSRSAASALAGILDRDIWLRLCTARVALAEILGLAFDSDLEGASRCSDLPLMPARLRYDGNLYRSAALAKAQFGHGRRLLIVSALYGLLDANDPIRHYDLEMKDMLPGRMSVKRWWREQGLPEIVCNTANNTGAEQLHDLLSGHYRDALRGLEIGLPESCSHIPYQYAGLGTGSDYHRGSDLKRLLG